MLRLSRRSIVSAACAAVVLAPAAAWAQAGGTAAEPPSRAASRLPNADNDFLEQAAQNSHAEIEASRLALTKTTNSEVKAFAQKMIDAHGKTNQELAALAAAKGVEVPAEASLVQKAKLKLLSVTDGNNFDRRYAESIGVEAHEDTIKLFEKAAARAADPEVKALATRTLPELRQHLAMAQALKAATVKAGGEKPVVQVK